MRATLVHHSLDGRGGAELVAVATMEALHEMGFRVDLVTIRRPELNALKDTFGVDLAADGVRSLLPSHVDYDSSIYHQTLAQILTIPISSTRGSDVVINTHADFPLPYLTSNGAPLISYVHFPHVAEICLPRKYPQKYQQSILWKLYFSPYHLFGSRVLAHLARYTLSKSIILTNSSFSKKAIVSSFPTSNPIVVRPPVDVQGFTHAFTSSNRRERVLVVGRIVPEKRLEDAIEILRLLPEHVEGEIAGTLQNSRRSLDYLEELKRKITTYQLGNRVEIRANLSRDDLVRDMAESAVYLHTMRGEHFGIATIEAMSAGLVPVVPDYGGQSEFVPKRYQYHTPTDAARIIEESIDVSENERSSIGKIARQFSKGKFKLKMKEIIKCALRQR